MHAFETMLDVSEGSIFIDVSGESVVKHNGDIELNITHLWYIR